MKITRSTDPILFFSKKEKEKIVLAIQNAEKKTSGEIRVHLERKIKGEILDHGKKIFEKIGMTKTQDRNSVLILMGVYSKRFIILGDQGINEKVPDGFWDEIVVLMKNYFKQDQFAEGIEQAVLRIGEKLQAYFPFQRVNVNELSDEISYSL